VTTIKKRRERAHGKSLTPYEKNEKIFGNNTENIHIKKKYVNFQKKKMK
jgi:hypothetical protein